jgi:hypothetical protein
MTLKLVKGTALSILIFFSTSFLTVLFQINSPLHRQTDSNLDIGFPLKYYGQFNVDEIPNSGWTVNNLLLDMIFIWTITTGIYLLLTKRKAQ